MWCVVCNRQGQPHERVNEKAQSICHVLYPTEAAAVQMSYPGLSSTCRVGCSCDCYMTDCKQLLHGCFCQVCLSGLVNLPDDGCIPCMISVICCSVQRLIIWHHVSPQVESFSLQVLRTVQASDPPRPLYLNARSRGLDTVVGISRMIARNRRGVGNYTELL